MKKIALILVLLASSGGTLFAQSTGNQNHGRGDYLSKAGIDLHVADPAFIDHYWEPKEAPAPKPTATVRTRYVAVLTIVQQASSAGTAEQQLNRRMQQFYNSLSNLGIPRTDIRDEFVSLQPTYRMDVVQQGNMPIAKRVHTGFEIKKTIRITFYDYNWLETILVRAADLQIFQLDQVEHLLSSN